MFCNLGHESSNTLLPTYIHIGVRRNEELKEQQWLLPPLPSLGEGWGEGWERLIIGNFFVYLISGSGSEQIPLLLFLSQWLINKSAH